MTPSRPGSATVNQVQVGPGKINEHRRRAPMGRCTGCAKEKATLRNPFKAFLRLKGERKLELKGEYRKNPGEQITSSARKRNLSPKGCNRAQEKDQGERVKGARYAKWGR